MSGHQHRTTPHGDHLEGRHGDGHAGEHHADHAGPAGEHHAGHADHGGHAGHADHVGQFRRLFWVTLALAVPVAALAPMVAALLGGDVRLSGGTAGVRPVRGTVIFAWGGRPCRAGAVAELRARQPGMMLLIGLAITEAVAASLGSSVALLPLQLAFSRELVLLTVIMLHGHWP